ncbi:MAG: hypothetical protein NXI14_00250 [bacterium]|nr:hypothetical protein [bacterium]
MKSNDTIKIVIAVVLLAAAGIFIVMQFGGGGGDGPRGGEPVGDDFTPPPQAPDAPQTPYGVPE